MEIYNTTWWGNAIDTAITAGTEPDFFGSQMKMLTGQPELVTNGDFATDSDWNKGGGVTISNGKALVTVINGGYQSLGQSLTYISGKSYTLTASVNGTVGKGCTFFDASGNNGGLNTSNGGVIFNGEEQSVKFKFTANSNSNTILISRSGAGDYNFSIDNVSVKLARAEEVEAVKCLADWIHTTALQDLNN
jgi:hypothetical protein